MPEMRIMGGKGDTKIIWDKDSPEEVENARNTFNDLKEEGYLAYEVDEDDASKGKVIRRFSAKAEKMILAPPMAGG
ncbi:hypothetical protein LCGC14_2704040 [marine sediment metagenome]|uniref:Uncharacterized protein n=1 Tax=marine sediment metagenome TaxID=412755 RepID=A0A0F9A2H5_9ZZZZ